VLFGEIVAPAPLFEAAREPVVVDAVRVGAFRAATHDDNAAGAAAPLAMTFPFAWRAVFRALAGARPDVVRLVHESETAAGALVPGEALTAIAQVRSVEDVDGGRRIAIDTR